MDLLKNKLILVTGGGAGLGAAIARGVALEGARVIVADINKGNADAVAKEIQDAGGKAYAEALDITDRNGVAAWAADIKDRIGAIDVLVNNAGISARSKIDDADAPEAWDRLLSVNLNGLFNVTHAFVPMLKTTKGSIINMCSVAAYVSCISSAGYVASKGGVRSFTQVLARELAPHGVRANAIAPGLMLTDMVTWQLEKPGFTDWFTDRAPMARGGRPEEIVGPVIFLASEMASYVTGVILPVDGGFLSA